MWAAGHGPDWSGARIVAAASKISPPDAAEEKTGLDPAGDVAKDLTSTHRSTSLGASSFIHLRSRRLMSMGVRR